MRSVPGSFWEWAASLQPSEQFPLLVLGGFAVIFIITLVACTIYAMHKNRLNDHLKRELLDRGLSADEIATVINAKPGKRVTSIGRGEK
jgi:hypothetical protein